MKARLLYFFILFHILGFSQDIWNNQVTKKVAISDSILISEVSITPYKFLVLNTQEEIIDSTLYQVNFSKSTLHFKQPKDVKTDSIIIQYTKYPDFVTKEYFLFDKNRIVENTQNIQKLYKFGQANHSPSYTPFSGLETSGSLSRGFSLGNNQNTVLNSELNLQITGKISDKISLRASLQDANIPLQEGGYSQKLNEFDQVFMELFSDNWLVRAGDVTLKNEQSYFGAFTKKVQGLYATGTITKDSIQTTLFAAGALVKGQYSSSTFNGTEGNQGPYKLSGSNGELFILLVSGSETVYVNGIALKRGENNDYTIDYNAGEVLFNANYPITSEMRITVEYQYSDQNYSRIVAYGGGRISSPKLKMSTHVYSENDAKNQPLQQNLTANQVAILQAAGNNPDLMTAPSATLESYSENKILYKKDIVDGTEIFVFSNNPEDELYQVKFSPVATNEGHYILSSNTAISAVFEYVSPIDGVPQGSFEPIIKLVAPTKLQMLVVNGSYTPNKKTTLNFEFAGSKNDLNLFSTIDDDQNNGFAGRLELNQVLIKKDSAWSLNTSLKSDYISDTFNTVERFNNIEFNRDWGLEMALGNQQLFQTKTTLYHPKKGRLTYAYEHLSFTENYKGNRHLLKNTLHFKKATISTNASLLKSSAPTFDTYFFRGNAKGIYLFNKAWMGANLNFEDNQQHENATSTLTNLSQRYSAYESFVGIGDSTKIYTKIGYKYRKNDSVRNGKLSRVNNANTYYLSSRLVKSNNANLSVFANYRTLDYIDNVLEKEQSLNSKIQYGQQFSKNLIALNTVFEVNSGVVPQQNFTFVEVDEGQGFYTWIDYNDNSIQELNEFEIAQFQDQANYIKILLPNQIFIKTAQNKWSLSLLLNPIQFVADKRAFLRFLSRFYNQASLLIDKKTTRESSFKFNLFSNNESALIATKFSLKNSLFLNRGKQSYTTLYSFSKNHHKSLLSTGFQENKSTQHQVHFTHKFLQTWLFNLKGELNNTQNNSENFANTTYEIEGRNITPKLSFLTTKNSSFDVFYHYTTQENILGNLERLEQQRFGVSFATAKKETVSINGIFTYYLNDFSGNSFSPVGYQMLGGLENGKNMTWTLFAQKRINKFLDLNLNYSGRKSESSKTIHTGTIQLKAFF